MENQLIDVDRLAAVLDVPVGNIYRLVRTRQIPFHKVGRKLRFDLKEVLSATRKECDN
jgi:excisionase family DNA binding protein